MSSDVRGWVEVAEIEEATLDAYEEADELARELDDDSRAVEVFGDDTQLVEIASECGERWVRVARITHDAPFDVSRDLNDDIQPSDDYRVVSVKHGGVVIEKRVSDE